MQVFETTYHAARNARMLFPREIENDPAIWFHGTTSVSEPEIDSSGFSGRMHPTIRQDVEAVVKVFKSMNWWGGDSGAVSNLTAYSLPRMDSEGRIGTYFRESPFRCVGYTTEAWSGGETVWSLRECFDYLRQYLSNEEMRAEHLDEQTSAFNQALAEDDWQKSPVIQVDPGWLRRQLELLEHIEKWSCGPRIQRTHGVVYAVRLSEEDFPWMDYAPAPGLSFRNAIRPERIVAKLRLNGELADMAVPRKWSDKKKFIRLFCNWQANNPTPPEKCRSEWEAMERDSEAGEDISALLSADRATTTDSTTDQGLHDFRPKLTQLSALHGTKRNEYRQETIV